jgi:hypothetical protein
MEVVVAMIIIACGQLAHTSSTFTSLGVVTGAIYTSVPQSFQDNAENILCEFAQLGVQWIRFEADWPNTPPQLYQSIVEIAHAKGIRVNALIHFRYCGDDTNEAEIDQFTEQSVQYLESLVESTFNGGGSVDSFEIGNEVNIWEDGCGDGQQRYRVSPNAFSWLLRRIYQWKQQVERKRERVSLFFSFFLFFFLFPLKT